jgi:DNA-binding NarL/FixJ family response regulator
MQNLASLLPDDAGHRAGPDVDSPLTPRELDVALLVQHGLTNRQIAEALVISERTVAAHVSSALGKLALRSRTQLALWTFRWSVAPLAPSTP